MLALFINTIVAQQFMKSYVMHSENVHGFQN